MNEFEVTVQQSTITANFEVMQNELKKMMTAYAGLEVTEENLPERKKDLATLRKIKNAVEDKRKAVKKEYDKPLKAFEAECKKLTGIIEKEEKRIDGECKAFEAKRREEKRQSVYQLYIENIGEYADFLPFDGICKDGWLNKGTSDAAILSDIQEMIMSVKNDLSVIETMAGEWLNEAVQAYKAQGNSLVSAMNRVKDLNSAREAAEKAVKAAEHPTTPTAQEVPAKPTEPFRWVFEITCFTEEDAKFIRNTCNIMDIDCKEV